MRLNGIAVDAICESKGVTNRELARRMGKSPQFVLRLRRGERTASLGTIQRAADAVEVPLEAVLLPHRPVKESA